MSTNAPALTAHPDREWANGLREALDAWCATEPASPSPTNSLTGTGAIAAAEQLLSERHGQRPTVLLPSGSYALYVALAAVGVGPDTDVLLPGLDWPASRHAVTALGGRPVHVDVDPVTLTIDPAAAAAARTPTTVAVVACHLHGVPADIPAIREALPGLPVIEDAAQAFGSTLDGHPVGTLGDLAAFSFGPGKTITAGEAGALICAEPHQRDVVLQLTAHPLRLLISGLDPKESANLPGRVYPAAAVLLWHQLTTRADSTVAVLLNEHERLSNLFGTTDPRRRIAANQALKPRAQRVPPELTSQPTAATAYTPQATQARDAACLVRSRPITTQLVS